tara:strand:- start:257 stop:868 length:612 start_codon:yes stop_codon:yes gene_type:complete
MNFEESKVVKDTNESTVASSLTENIEALCMRLLPQGRKIHGTWQAGWARFKIAMSLSDTDEGKYCPIWDGNNPAIQIELVGNTKGAWENRAAARRKAADVIARLKDLRLGKAAELVERAVDETLTYYAVPEEHWRGIRTNNPLERIMREIRRRTRVVGAFPDGNSALNLAAARLRHIAGTHWSTKRYLNMDLLKHHTATVMTA